MLPSKDAAKGIKFTDSKIDAMVHAKRVMDSPPCILLIVVICILWFKRKIQLLTKENLRLDQSIHELLETSANESEFLSREWGHRMMPPFDWRAEMVELRKSWVKHHVSPTEYVKPRFRMPAYVDDVLQTLVDGIEEIEKTDTIMNLFYCSFDDMELGIPESNGMIYPGIETYASVYLMTTHHLYEVRADGTQHHWDAHGIHLRASTPPANQYGFHPLSEIKSNVDWYTVSVLIHATKGNIGKAVNRTFVYQQDGTGEQQPFHYPLPALAKRYIGNIVHAVAIQDGVQE